MPLRRAACALRPPAVFRRLRLAGCGLLAMLGSALAAEPEPIRLRVVGGLAELSQYVRHEEPFWTRRVPAITNGRIQPEIAPFDRSGIRGQEMLQLLRLGVVPYGTVMLGIAAGDEPELNAMDLPVLSPDIVSLRRTVALWQPRMEQMLRERYGVELLAIYTYAAQVLFCRSPFRGLDDLRGRRIRTSSIGQSELMSALGATPVVIPFAETTSAIRAGVVECAITGMLSGNVIGLHEVTTHVSRQAITWGVVLFGANQAAWASLPPELRERLRQGLAQLQSEIWDAADREMEEGLACNAGLPGCTTGRPGRMVVVQQGWQGDASRTRLLTETVLPRWVQRCGTECAEAWNRYMAPSLGIRAQP